MILFGIFIFVPLIEIALFVMVGDEIGVVSTLLLCVLTAIAGSFLVRWQGLKTLFAAKAAMEHGRMPVHELFDGVCITLAGLLLILPGFFTDAMGFALLTPRIRTWLRGQLARHFELDPDSGQGFHRQSETYIIDAEYERIEEQDKP